MCVCICSSVCALHSYTYKLEYMIYVHIYKNENISEYIHVCILYTLYVCMYAHTLMWYDDMYGKYIHLNVWKYIHVYTYM